MQHALPSLPLPVSTNGITYFHSNFNLNLFTVLALALALATRSCNTAVHGGRCLSQPDLPLRRPFLAPSSEDDDDDDDDD